MCDMVLLPESGFIVILWSGQEYFLSFTCDTRARASSSHYLFYNSGRRQVMTLREMLSDIHALEEEMLAFERKCGVAAKYR